MPLRAPDSLSPPPIDILTGASLLLDFDGTLVEIAPTPDSVSVDDPLRQTLACLDQAFGGRVALISGRAVSELQRLIGVETLAVAGSHGLELYWGDGRIEAPERPATLTTAEKAMDGFAASRPGVLVERKPLGVGLHFRLAPDAAEEAAELAHDLAARTGLKLQTGKMMFELRAAGADKGSALHRLMASPGMKGSLPVFLGDDDTDEPGFVAAEALGGAGVLVGPPRATNARYHLADVAAVRVWLDTACREIA
ncbi:trehalose 6-phosphate phosphatase [Sphingomonas zeicaulis]|uniref:trehalose-phosphatase n=1 Tax=Sphingomonas zeicaulis TaxID=1632740 RepID=UPI003D1E4E06